MDKHPMQPLEIDEHGVVRFKANRLVRYLLDNGGLNMNDLALAAAQNDIPDEDQEQFAQLIGYSVSGFGDLGYVNDKAYDRADRLRHKMRAERRERGGR